MKVSITSDGTASGTRIIDLKTGDEVRHVKKLEIRIDADVGIALAEITLIAQAQMINVLAERIK